MMVLRNKIKNKKKSAMTAEEVAYQLSVSLLPCLYTLFKSGE